MDVGKRRMNMISKLTHLSLIFVFDTIQPFPNAFLMLPSIGKARPRITARLRPRNIDIRCCDWSQPRRHETRDFVTASVCVLDRHRHATGRRSDVNTHLVSDKGHWIGGLGMAQVTGEGKNAVLRWYGVTAWLKVTVSFCSYSD